MKPFQAKEGAVTLDQIFSAANFVALCCWLLLVALPRKRWVANGVAGVAVPSLFAALYTGVIAAHLADSEGGFSTLSGVALLFSNPWLLLAGWIHYLAFDLFTGMWIARDADAKGFSRLAQAPVLLATFLAGPLGLFTWLAIRERRARALGRWE